MDLFNSKKVKDLELKYYTLERINSELRCNINDLTSKVTSNYSHISDLTKIVKNLTSQLNELDVKVKYLNQLFDELNTAKKYDENVTAQAEVTKPKKTRKTKKTAKEDVNE